MHRPKSIRLSEALYLLVLGSGVLYKATSDAFFPVGATIGAAVAAGLVLATTRWRKITARRILIAITVAETVFLIIPLAMTLFSDVDIPYLPLVVGTLRVFAASGIVFDAEAHSWFDTSRIDDILENIFLGTLWVLTMVPFVSLFVSLSVWPFELLFELLFE